MVPECGHDGDDLGKNSISSDSSCYFPTVVRIRPVPDAVSRRFEVAEILDLQAVRDEARSRRSYA